MSETDNHATETEDGKTRIMAIVPQRVQTLAAPSEPREMSVQDLIAQTAKVQEVMRAVMIPDLHYGKIPGCGDKPTLLKPGAEKLALVFQFAPSFIVDETDLPNGHKHFRVVCKLTHIHTGRVHAEGVGYGSTMEGKYRWRNSDRKCPACGKPTIKKSKYPPRGSPNEPPGYYCYAKLGGCGAEFGADDKAITGQSEARVENPDIADTYNTVLKMAKKRAQIDATLTATSASDIFAQDLEDLAAAAAEVAAPATKPAQTEPERGAEEMGAAFDEADVRSLCDQIRAAKTLAEVDALDASAGPARIPSAEGRQRVHVAAGLARAEFKRAEAAAAPKKPKGTAKLRDELLKSLDSARAMEDVKNCFEAIKKYGWSEADGERLMDRVSMRKQDFANAAGAK